MKQSPKRVLFVCLGNICRSPTAEAVFKKEFKKKKIETYFDSAGTAGYHIGERSDPRTIKHGEARGYVMDHLGRQFGVEDFENFDLIFAMDDSNYQNILKLCKNSEHKSKVHKMAEFCTLPGISEVPDPYHGSGKDFEEVIDILENCVDPVIQRFYR